MKVPLQETSAKWALALGTLALCALCLTSTAGNGQKDRTASPEPPAEASNPEFAGSYRRFLHFIGALC